MEAGRRSVIVVGAGVIGAAIAFELQRRGQQVTLLDRGEPGRGTSFGNMASVAIDFAAGSNPSTWRKIPDWLLDPEGPVWLRPSYALKMLPWFLRFIAAGRPSRLRRIEDAGINLSRHALRDFRAMLDAIGAPEMMTEEGCLAIYETEAEYASDRSHLALMQRHGLDFEILNGGAIRNFEPALSPSIAKAVLLPDNKSIRDPYQLVVRLVEAARSRGAEFRSAAARTVERKPEGGISLRLESGEEIAADAVVLAAGVRTGFLAERLGEPIPLESERGYHTQIMRPGISMRYSIILPHRAFMVTPTAGGIRVGGNVELAGLDAPPDFRRARVLVRHAQRVLPGLKVEGATEWMGHRRHCRIRSPSSRPRRVCPASGMRRVTVTSASHIRRRRQGFWRI